MFAVAELTPESQADLLRDVVSVRAAPGAAASADTVDITGDKLVDRAASQESSITRVLFIPAWSLVGHGRILWRARVRRDARAARFTL
jgi:hypothetical protein